MQAIWMHHAHVQLNVLNAVSHAFFKIDAKSSKRISRRCDQVDLIVDLNISSLSNHITNRHAA